MTSRFTMLGAALLVCSSAFQQLQANEPNTLTAGEQKSGWKLLFDGQSMDHFRNYKKDTVSSGWVVEEGAIVRKENGAGDIVTKDQYGSFELSIEFKIAPEGNSGIMYHVLETDGPPWHTGPEIQVQDNVKGHDPQKAGWLYQLYQPSPDLWTGQITDSTRPAGEWNQIQFLCTPGGCEINMNGVRYARFNMGNEDWDKRVAASKFAKFEGFGKAGKGHICLQDHGNLVSYRNIKIRELPENGVAPEPIDGTLPVKVEKTFTKIEWEGWSPEDERGRLQFFRPIIITNAADGTNRLFVAEQHGVIFSFVNSPDVTKAARYLDITDRVQYSDRSNEEGLLGVAFHPQYKSNGQVYAYYTRKETHISVISRFTKSQGDPNKADPASEEVLMEIEQPFWNHNGGTICFGPDGYLYVGLGDGGSANDPMGNGQNLGTLLGSILRIDVDHKSEGKNYAIPADNPFVGKEGARPEIYAYGLRNVWRIAFDRETGKLWCGDVGQNLWEEIDIIVKGGNYGWGVREGSHPFNSTGVDANPNMVEPIWEYDHQVGKSITGGSVYRGQKVPELAGQYIYADYVTGKVWALHYDEAAGKVVSNKAIPTDMLPIITFGEDEQGEIYFGMVTNNGQGIYRFVSDK